MLPKLETSVHGTTTNPTEMVDPPATETTMPTVATMVEATKTVATVAMAATRTTMGAIMHHVMANPSKMPTVNQPVMVRVYYSKNPKTSEPHWYRLISNV